MRPNQYFNDMLGGGQYTPPIDTGYTKLLMHYNGSTYSLDSSTYSHTMIPNQVATSSTSKFGQSSFSMSSTMSYFTTATSSDWNFGKNDFTIDFWWRCSAFYGEGAVCQQLVGTNSGWRISTGVSDGGGGSKLLDTSFSSYNIIDGHTFIGFQLLVNFDTWYHISYVRNGIIMTNYITSGSGISTIQDPFGGLILGTFSGPFGYTSPLTVGHNSVDIYTYDYAVNGSQSAPNTQVPKMLIDELRKSKGIARYVTATFSDPTSEYNPSS